MKTLLHISIAITFCFFISCNEDNNPIYVPQPTGAVLDPNVGGPSEPNQIWIDLDMQTMKENRRDSWDFGFYGGDKFKVIINNSIMMAAGKTNATSIDEVTEASVSSLKPLVAVGNFQANNTIYVDDIKGNYLERTAIDEISAIDDENKVYLVNMGYSVYTGNSTALTVTGDSRGWKKIRILRSKTGYKIQYADISDTTHQEILIEKKSDYHFSFFSLTDGIVDIQPPKNNWDICFTVSINEISGFGTYNYADYIITNTLSNTEAYQVTVSESLNYDSFTKENVDYSKFISKDQNVIGANWRQTYGGASVFTDRFYILKDNLGTLYKIRFLKLTNNEGHRGYPQFEYAPLN